MTDKTGCIHYWLIDSEDVGICKYCGATKNFRAVQAREKAERHKYLYQFKVTGNQGARKRGRPRLKVE